jgi:hypothetical protein
MAVCERQEDCVVVRLCIAVYFNILCMKYCGQLDLNEPRQTPTQV